MNLLLLVLIELIELLIQSIVELVLSLMKLLLKFLLLREEVLEGETTLFVLLLSGESFLLELLAEMKVEGLVRILLESELIRFVLLLLLVFEGVGGLRRRRRRGRLVHLTDLFLEFLVRMKM